MLLSISKSHVNQRGKNLAYWVWNRHWTHRLISKQTRQLNVHLFLLLGNFLLKLHY